MGRIHQLDHATADGIAAGEVVERPSSVVKELVENSIDAGATVISIEISGGGISLIRITDNGCGMDEEDARMSFMCHATSKLSTLDDLFSLHTMGFRGEALSSIAAASRVNLKTCQPGAETGTQIEIEAGRIVRVSRTGGPGGTRIEVRDLFFNLPARYKFLKKDTTEAQYIAALVERFALIRPDISFRLISQGKEILHSPGNNDPQSTLYCIYGKQIVDQCIPIDEPFGELQISGFVGKPEIAKSSRGEQTVFVNDRLIRSKTITSAIDEAYKTMLMKGRYAFLILSIRIPSSLVDVNVHPQKAEVRFWNDSEVFRGVYHTVNNALLSVPHVIEPQAQVLFGSAGREDAPEAVPQSDALDQTAVVSVADVPFEEPKIPQAVSRTEAVLKSSYSFPEQPEIRAFAENTFAAESRDAEQTSAEDTAGAAEHQGTQAVPDAADVSTQAGPYGFSVGDLKNARIIGTAFSTYILLELDKQIILLDQHAAHEKILFEKLVRDHEMNKGKELLTQPLLVPVILSMTPSDMLFLHEMTDSLEKAGFRFASMGEKEVILREIPSVSCEYQPETAFRFTIDSLRRETPKTDEEMLLILATGACKAAVKGHDHLDELEIKGLLSDLSGLRDPFHCPHGRPIMIRLSQKELEKEFKRIV